MDSDYEEGEIREGEDEDMLDARVENRGEGEVTRMGLGESYRPLARPRSPRADDFRDSPRRDIRDRGRSPLGGDSYHPGGRDSPRRRTRTPPYRRDRTPPRTGGRGGWSGRPRSPEFRARSLLRRFSPRRDDRRDSDRRDNNRRDDDWRDRPRRSRSPYNRDRGPVRARSPFPPRRDGPGSARGGWRSRTPDRRPDLIQSGPNSSNWRRRSPSPLPRESRRSSELASETNSRRSSPPNTSYRSSAQPPQRARSPLAPPPRDRSPVGTSLAFRERESARSTPKSTPRNLSPVPHNPAAKSPPRGPAVFKAPTGPSNNRFTSPTTMRTNLVGSGTGNSPAPMAPFTRSDNTAPPAGPRGVPAGRGFPHPRGGSPFMRGRGGYVGIDRQSHSDNASWGSAPQTRPQESYNRAGYEGAGRGSVGRHAPSPGPSAPPTPTASTLPGAGPPQGIPTGPRAGTGPSRPSVSHASGMYGHGRAPMTTSPGARVHPAMAHLPPIIPGGRIDPTATGMTPEIAQRLKKREEEAEVLREDLKLKQEKLRKGLKIWDKLSRDSASMGLRSELSERHVRMLAGEGVGGKAF